MAKALITAGLDNSIDRVFKAVRLDGTVEFIGAEQFDRFTAMLLPLEGGAALSFDSQLLGLGAGLPFDHSQAVEIAESVDGNGNPVPVRYLQLRLGGQSIPTGFYNLRIVCYDATHPNGFAWGKDEQTEVRV